MALLTFLIACFPFCGSLLVSLLFLLLLINLFLFTFDFFPFSTDMGGHELHDAVGAGHAQSTWGVGLSSSATDGGSRAREVMGRPWAQSRSCGSCPTDEQITEVQGSHSSRSQKLSWGERTLQPAFGPISLPPPAACWWPVGSCHLGCVPLFSKFLPTSVDFLRLSALAALCMACVWDSFRYEHKISASLGSTSPF